MQQPVSEKNQICWECPGSATQALPSSLTCFTHCRTLDLDHWTQVEKSLHLPTQAIVGPFPSVGEHWLPCVDKEERPAGPQLGHLNTLVCAFLHPIMVVTQLNLEFRFQGKKLRGFSCELIRTPHGFFPETVFTITFQIVVPILLSGLGMMAAGFIMNTIQVRTG